MKSYNLEDFINGWIIGDFEPTILRTKEFEVCVKEFTMGQSELEHKQLFATEITLVIRGKARMGDVELNSGDILRIDPGEFADFEAVTDCIVLGVKFPSLPNDKVLRKNIK